MPRPASPARPGVVIFAGLDWWYHNQAHADFQLGLEISRHRRVLVVNSIGTRFPTPGRSTQPLARIRRKLGAIGRGLRAPRPDRPEFFVYSPLPLPAYSSAWGRRLNRAVLRWQVRAAVAWLRLGVPAVLVTPPTALELAVAMPHTRLVYTRSDKHSAWSEVDHDYLRGLELRLLAEADVVLYVSHALMAEDAELTGARAVFLDHGVDLQAFAAPGPEPADVRSIARPRMGYLGALRGHTVDLALLTRLAEEIPEAQLILVGPSTMDLGDLPGRPNVHVLGQRPLAAVPAYAAAFDVALLPWLDNDWIRACNPIKTKEYLALGLPTVSMDYPEVRRYAGHIAVAADADAFVRAVRAALDRPEPADDPRRRARRAAVAEDSWTARAETVLTLLGEDDRK